MRSVLLRSAQAAVAAGEIDAVRGMLREAESAGIAPEERREWALLLVQAGLIEEAQRLGGSEEIARTLLADPPEEEAEPSWAEPELGPLMPEVRPAETALFLRWFGGRRDLYARQWFDERRRRTGYHPIEQPLTEEVARAHLEGRMTVGQYLLCPDGTVSYGVLDLDLAGGALEDLRAERGEEVSALAHGGLRSYVTRLLEAGRTLGLPLFAEDSGGRGAHLWMFLEPRRPARAMRALLAQVVLAAGPQPPDVRVEIFPKQERTGPRGLSSLVKLPLGLHQATLRRCPLLDDALEPIADPVAALERLEAAPADAVEAVVGRRVLPLPLPTLVPEDGPVALPRAGSARSLAEALRAIEPGREEREACERMLGGCAVLAGLVKKAFEEHRLASDEARALLYTIGLVGPGCRLIEEVFATAQVSRKELDRARLGLPSPTGCQKLRRSFPELAKACRCATGKEALPYATPALFAVGARAPSAPTWGPFAPWLEGEYAAGDPLEAVARALGEIQARLEALEKKE
jgi:hypothetical protein